MPQCLAFFFCLDSGVRIIKRILHYDWLLEQARYGNTGFDPAKGNKELVPGSHAGFLPLLGKFERHCP